MDVELKYVGNKRVFVILVATEYRIPLHNLIQNLKKQGYSYLITQYKKPWKGWKTKWEGFIEASQNIIQEYGEDTTCVAMDAYDTAILRPAEDFIKEYDMFHIQNPSCKLLCGLEHICNPKNCGYIESYWEQNNINSLILQKKYVNAGCVIGKAKHLLEVYKWIISNSTEKDDQKALANYVNLHPSFVKLDMGSHFIKNKKFLEPLSPSEMQSRGAFFLHYPGLSSYSLEHSKALKMFGGPLVLKSPDYHYLAKKFYAGVLENKFIIYFIILLFLLLIF